MVTGPAVTTTTIWSGCTSTLPTLAEMTCSPVLAGAVQRLDATPSAFELVTVFANMPDDACQLTDTPGTGDPLPSATSTFTVDCAAALT